MKEFTIMELAQKFVGKCDKCPMHVSYHDYEDWESDIDYCSLRYSESELETSGGEKHIVHFKLEPDKISVRLKN